VRKLEKVRVALVKGENRRENVRKALELVQEYIAAKVKGDVLIKPNFLSVKRQLASTHVNAVRGVLDIVSQLSFATLVVAEGANGGEPMEAFKNFGYYPLTDEYKVSLIDLNLESDREEIKLYDLIEREVPAMVSKRVIQSACRISVAIPKTHDTAIVTLTLKNMMGSLARSDRSKMHGYADDLERDFLKSVRIMPKNLIALGKHVAPHVGVIDGFLGMEGRGPGGGDEVPLGIAIASADFLAADAVAAKIMGFEPLEVGYIYYANELGMGVGDLSNIEVLGANIEDVQRKFKPHANYPTQKLWKVDS
jgi:uncharacterized protein (DUF362 family)